MNKPTEQPTSWETEFDERFTDNGVYLNELASEIYQGDIDLKSIKAFIRKTITQERRKELQYIRDNSSGSGSWRRVIAIRLAALEGK